MFAGKTTAASMRDVLRACIGVTTYFGLGDSTYFDGNTTGEETDGRRARFLRLLGCLSEG